MKKALEDSVLALVEIESPQVEDLDVEVMPTLLFLTPDGREISRHVGYRPSEEVIELIENARGKLTGKR